MKISVFREDVNQFQIFCNGDYIQNIFAASEELGMVVEYATTTLPGNPTMLLPVQDEAGHPVLIQRQGHVRITGGTTRQEENSYEDGSPRSLTILDPEHDQYQVRLDGGTLPYVFAASEEHGIAIVYAMVEQPDSNVLVGAIDPNGNYYLVELAGDIEIRHIGNSNGIVFDPVTQKRMAN